MDWSSLEAALIPNLISEAMGILFTVLLVDRLLARRERRRWRLVHAFLVSEAKTACDGINAAWAEWLTTVATDVAEMEPSEATQSILHTLGYSKEVGSEAITVAVERSWGRPVGSAFQRLANPHLLNRTVGRSFLEEALHHLVLYLVRRPLPEAHPSWRGLQERLRGPVCKLLEVMNRYATIVPLDPDFAIPVIRLHLEMNNLESGAYKQLASAGSISARWPAAVMTMCEGIRQTIRLNHYIRRYGVEVAE